MSETKNKDRPALLPCPFCGSTSTVWSDHFQRVRCNGCFIGTSPPNVRITGQARDDLIMRSVAQWNARAFPSEADRGLLEEIRDAMPKWIYCVAENGEHDNALVKRYLDPLIDLIGRLGTQ